MGGEMRVAVTVTAVAIGGGVVTAAPAEGDIEVTYSVHQRGDVQGDMERFARTVDRTLHDDRGWSLAGEIEFRRVDSDGDLRVVLASPTEIGAAASGCDESWSCRVGQYALINDRRWNDATESWTRSRGAYRQYVINHEVGHFLGLGHAECAEAGSPAPVMQQQSISLDECRANVWPRLAELRVAARAQGISAPSSSPAPSPSPSPSPSPTSPAASPGHGRVVDAESHLPGSPLPTPGGGGAPTEAQQENLFVRLLRYLSGLF